MRASNLIKIGHDGVPLQPTRHAVNRAGFVIHSVVHAARADVHCVMHTHTTAGMAIACKREGLGHDDFYGAELFGDVAYHAFEGITVHDAEGPRLVASLGDKRVLVLRNHGLLVTGSDVFNAFRWMWTLQRACEVQLAAAALPGPDVAADRRGQARVRRRRARIRAQGTTRADAVRERPQAQRRQRRATRLAPATSEQRSERWHPTTESS